MIKGCKTRTTDGRIKKIFFIEGTYQLKKELDDLLSLTNHGSALVLNIPYNFLKSYIFYLTDISKEVLAPVPWFEKICGSFQPLLEAIHSLFISPIRIAVYG